MILVSAQTKPYRFDTEKNLQEHYRFIEQAANHNANLIVFPELSLTGYERDKARELAFSENDPRLEHLKTLASGHQIIVIAGAPLVIDNRMFIASFVIYPSGEVQWYTKQYLHPGEEEFYSSSFSYNPRIELHGEQISLAICADIDNPQHACDASKVKSTIYMPSIFFSPGGLPEAFENLSTFARTYSMHVLMSNFCVEAWGRPAGGKSAFWDNTGKLVGNLNGSDPGLLIAEKTVTGWKALSVYM